MDTHDGAFFLSWKTTNIAQFAEKVHKNYLEWIRTTWKDIWCNELLPNNAYGVNDHELVKRAMLPWLRATGCTHH